MAMYYNDYIPNESELEEGEVIILPNRVPNLPSYSPPRDVRPVVSSSESSILPSIVGRQRGGDIQKQNEINIDGHTGSFHLHNVAITQEKDFIGVPNKNSISPSDKTGNKLNRKRVKKARGGKKKKRQSNKEKKIVIKLFTPICKFYLDGRCTKGSSCEFRHEGELIKKKEPCKFYIRDGSCYRGKDCAYMHQEFPCKFHYWGNCRSQPCRFYHGSLSEDQETMLKEHIAKSAQAPVEMNPTPIILDPKEYTSASSNFFLFCHFSKLEVSKKGIKNKLIC